MRSFATRKHLVARDPHGVVHLVYGIGVGGMVAKNEWIASCEKIFPIQASTVLNLEAVTCLTCACLDDGR